MERSSKRSRVNRIEADGGERDEKIPWLTQFVLVCVHACACLTLRARLRAQEGKNIRLQCRSREAGVTSV